MLASLHIENIAIIKSVDVDFSIGFTAFTGETGAGKSIIIDSINLLLGAKCDKELIRHGESYAMVSGFFSNLSERTVAILEEQGLSLDDDGCFLIQRTVFSDGRSQIKINGRTVTLSMLRAIAPALVVIHGQHDTMSIAAPKKQLEFIDVFAGNNDLLNEYKSIYSELEAVKKEITQISKNDAERERLIEMLEYQIKDINSYSLTDGEEEELVDKKIKIKSNEKILKNAGFVFKALKGSEKGSVCFLLDRSIASLEQISDVIPEFSEYANVLRDFRYRADDIAEQVYANIEDAQEDPTEALNKIESRLDKISKLKRKYGYSIAEILAYRDKSEAELKALSSYDDKIEELTKKESKLYNEALSVADKLHNSRVAAAKSIEQNVKDTLFFLDMPKVTFFVSFSDETEGERKALHSSGYDRAEFYISANIGADAQPIEKVASGGELARVMLALKAAIADKDGGDTIIFDEIDAGVSGKTARKIGIKMLALSEHSQLFSVTHSAQIASLADSHLLIKKNILDGETATELFLLDEEGRINELSRILGGIDITESQRMAASDMLNERKKYSKRSL